VFPLEDSVARNADLATSSLLVGTNRMAVLAKEAAARALALDPEAAEIHRVMAVVHFFADFNWDAANTELNRARTLDPGNALISKQSSLLAMTTGRLTEALEFAKIAISLDPLGTAYSPMGRAYFRLGELDEAAAAFRRLIELHPTKAGYHFVYGLVLLAQHQPQAALEQMQRDEPWYRQTGVALALDALGHRADADEARALAELNWGNGMAYQISYLYAARGEVDQAIAWLERAYRQRDAGLSLIVSDPMLKSLAHIPSFKALLRRLKLPDTGD
jgi:tetratricopeptide (TPR) repeat protein